MKIILVLRLVIFSILLFQVHFYSFAQASYQVMMDDYSYNFYEVVEAAEEHFSKNTKGKGSGYKQYIRWRYLNEGKYAPNGNRKNVDHRVSVKAYEEYLNTRPLSAKKSVQNTWQELGPDYSVWYDNRGPNGVGRVDDFWVNPTNENELFLTSQSGGFWKTNNGGANWFNTTDNLVATGVNTMSVNPFNNNEILINIRNPANALTYGVYKSTNRGNNWQSSNFIPDDNKTEDINSLRMIFTIEHHPKIQNMVFIGANTGLYRSVDNLLNNYLVSDIGQDVIDIEFHPTDPSIIYMIGRNNNKIYRSNDEGLNFDLIYSIPTNDTRGQRIDVSAASPNNLWYASSGGVWKSTNNGGSFQFIVKPTKSIYEFAVSDTDPTKQLMGHVDVYRTTTENVLVQSTNWYSTDQSKYIHADLRSIDCIDGIFYAGTDGFLVKTEDAGISWTRLNEKGTAIRENYNIAVSQGNNQYFMTGSQDNGMSVHYNDEWYEILAGDGLQSIIHPINESWLWTGWGKGDRVFMKNRGHVHVTGFSTGVSSESFFSDPNDPMHLYAFDTNGLSESNGYDLNWQVIGSHGLGMTSSADISYHNPNVFIAANYDGIVKLSTNKGQNWNDISGSLDLPSVKVVKINPNDDQVFIAASESFAVDGLKVFVTFDRGQNWENITHNLGSMPILSVEIDHTAQQNIYLGTELGIFTKPLYGSNTWTKYADGLPNVTVRDMDIHRGSNELFAATWGRGSWKVDLVGRENYPKIKKTIMSEGPTDELPKVGEPQYITSIIEYNGNLSKVELLWSDGDASFDHKISMMNIAGNTWQSTTPLPSCEQQRIFFKVQATGSQNDLSETYKFTYKVKGEPTNVRGDVNNDGVVRINDAYKIAKYSVNLISDFNCNTNTTQDEICDKVADYNCDGVVNILDAANVAQCVVGLNTPHCPN